MRLDLKIVFMVAFWILSNYGFGQRPTREIRGSVNTQSFNDIFPSMSGDGNTLVFMNDYSDDGGYIIMLSRKEAGGKWGKPVELAVLNPARVNAPGGYCLSFDGNILAYSTIKGESVGGYDLWYMEYVDGRWTNPRNFGFPINSSLNDSYPSFSPDGSELYFTRCTSIDEGGGRGCKIFISKKKRGRIKGWEAPVEMDGKINNGNASMPKMLPDNRSLIFSSDMTGGKGGLDWYITRKEKDETWTKPLNMDFMNTTEDDLFLTAYYRPDRAYTAAKNTRDKFNIVEVDVPEPYQPDKVVIKIGKVLNSNGEPVDSDVRVRDYVSGESVAFTFPDLETGDYTLIIPEGRTYDFSIVPKRSPEFYYSEILDYSTLRSSRKENADYTLKVPGANTALALKTLKYIPNKATLGPQNEQEIQRLVRLLNRNENFNFEIAAYQDSIITDSIPRPELTEVITDTTRWDEWVYEYEYQYQYQINEDSVKATFPEFTSQQLDSMLAIWNDSLSRVRNDTILAESFLASLIGVDTIEHVVDTIQHVDVKYTYHNDLTQKRAQSLADILSDRGIDPGRIIPVGYGDWKRPITAIKPEDFDEGFVEIIFKRL